MTERISLKNIFLYMGLTAGQYRAVRARVAEKICRNLSWMSVLMCIVPLIMIPLDRLFFHQGFSVLFLTVAAAGLIIRLVIERVKRPHAVLVLAYFVLAFLFSFAIIVTASRANAGVPATSIIVYLVLLPMLVPDVGWRMRS